MLASAVFFDSNFLMMSNDDHTSEKGFAEVLCLSFHSAAGCRLPAHYYYLPASATGSDKCEAMFRRISRGTQQLHKKPPLQRSVSVCVLVRVEVERMRVDSNNSGSKAGEERREEERMDERKR